MTRNLNTGLGIDWQPGFQEGLVSNRGSDMIHELGIACPRCRVSDVQATMLRDGQFQTRSPNCMNCGGDGRIYRDPVKVRGLATSIRQQRNVVDVGEVQPGDMQFSIGPGFFGCGQGGRRISRDDKFIALWDQPLDEGQTIVRGASTLHENKRFVNNVNEDEDRLWYEPATALWCEDENGVTYQLDTDFSFGPGRVIKWIGNQPNVGIGYTLKYTAYFEWIVWAPPQERNERDNRDLGPLVFLRRRHVAYVNDSPLITESDRSPLSARTSV